MSRATVVSVIRELARCYQAFERASDAHIRRMGLTPPQFDIVATLGNTPGMAFKELGSRTLITKGTLTGVVDRLATRGLVERAADPDDGRVSLVRLTDAGRERIDRAARELAAAGFGSFAALDDGELGRLSGLLGALRRETPA